MKPVTFVAGFFVYSYLVTPYTRKKARMKTMRLLTILLPLLSTQGKAMKMERIVKLPSYYERVLERGPINMKTCFFNLEDDNELVGTIAGSAYKQARLHSIKAPNSFEVYRYLRLSAYSNVADFQLAQAGPKREVEIYLGENEKIIFNGLLPSSNTNAEGWSDAFLMAAATQEWQLLDKLVQISDSMCTDNNEVVSNDTYLMNKALRGYWLKDKNTPQYTLDALAALHPDNFSDEDFKNSAIYIDSPLMDLLYHIILGENEAFNKSLIEAIESFKTKVTIDNDPEDFPLAFAILGLVSLAHRRGIEITVESDYIPKTIYSGTYSSDLYGCPYCVTPIPKTDSKFDFQNLEQNQASKFD